MLLLLLALLCNSSGRSMTFEWGDAEDMMAHIRGLQIEDGRIGSDGLYLHLSDQRVLVIVCLPSESLGLSLRPGLRLRVTSETPLTGTRCTSLPDTRP